MTPEPIHPIRRRGRPWKKLSVAAPSPVEQSRGGEYNTTELSIIRNVTGESINLKLIQTEKIFLL
jgi:hypothetical protein